jgi:hypothetical protein
MHQTLISRHRKRYCVIDRGAVLQYPRTCIPHANFEKIVTQFLEAGSELIGGIAP